MRMRQKTNFSINMEILICFSSLGNELPLRVNLHNNIDGPRYRAKEREAFRGESMWAHYRQYPGSYLNKREIFPSTTITQYLFTNRGYIEKIGKKSDQRSHQREKIFNEKKIEVKLYHTTPKRLYFPRVFFSLGALW